MEAYDFDLWLLLAGLGVFLYGMKQLEHALTELGGASFRKLLRRFTNTSWKGVLVGILLTSILQSSSLVTLMVLAFLGAKILKLKNALGVILGANVGTVVTAWLVATLGFSLPIKAFALPFIGLGSLSYMFLSNRPFVKNLGMFLLGFGLLFLGLDFMKEAIEAVAKAVSLDAFAQYGLWVFLLVGIVVTALIQSSSAMIVIILSSMHAGVIDLTQGAALVIGANIGTTITVGLGALNGIADKKRLALAHLVFNFVTGLIFFTFLNQVIQFMEYLHAFKDPLLQLVFLSTIIKVGGVIMFLPTIQILERWLQKRFRGSEAMGLTTYVKNVSTHVPEIAIQAVEKELPDAFNKCFQYQETILGLKKREKATLPYLSLLRTEEDTDALYAHIKQLEDEITDYSFRLQEQALTETEAANLSALVLSLRRVTYSAKEIRDIHHNIKDMMKSNDKTVKWLLNDIAESFDRNLFKIRTLMQEDSIQEFELTALKNNLISAYPKDISELYNRVRENPVSDVSVSSLTNVIRKVNSALQYHVDALMAWRVSTDLILPEIAEM
ncbi:MAG: Na/Pi cotransporter family protein [Cryomorphaceae bacterium]|nr:Na/Pi cotransporter family protein [Cryomorphaceae bacterium]